MIIPTTTTIVCASHVSHFPTDVADYTGKRVALGMNEEEIRENGQVDEYVVKDLNADPTLPFPDNSFDIVTNAVSIGMYYFSDVYNSYSLLVGLIDILLISNKLNNSHGLPPSIDYLNKPLSICKEVARVLKPGGVAMFALSNRCFPTKAINLWLRTNDLEHVFIVGSYFHYTGTYLFIYCTSQPTKLHTTLLFL